jgi:hypothetical protein
MVVPGRPICCSINVPLEKPTYFSATRVDLDSLRLARRHHRINDGRCVTDLSLIAQPPLRPMLCKSWLLPADCDDNVLPAGYSLRLRWVEKIVPYLNLSTPIICTQTAIKRNDSLSMRHRVPTIQTFSELMWSERFAPRNSHPIRSARRGFCRA